MKLKIVFICMFLFFSCKKQDNYSDSEKLCQTLLKIHKEDQKYRELMSDPFFKILDSIQISEGISNKEYGSFSEEKQLAYGKKAREIANKRVKKYTQKQEDSLMQLQVIIDNKNTELLIDIIKENGFPNLPDCKGDKFPAMVLRHAQSQYWDELKVLINKEFKAGRMNKGQFMIVLNHINGREDFKVTKKRLDTTNID